MTTKNLTNLINQINEWNTVPPTASLTDRCEATQQLAYLWKQVRALPDSQRAYWNGNRWVIAEAEQSTFAS